MEPHQLLLVLILFAGPDDQAVGKALADAIQQEATADVEVRVGNESLVEFGIQRTDLIATPSLGSHLTRSMKQIVLVDLDYRQVGPRNGDPQDRDHLVEAQLWLGGHYDVYTTIAGQGGDPIPGLIDGVMPMLRPVISVADKPQVQVAVPLATLVKRKQWTPVLTKLAEQGRA